MKKMKAAYIYGPYDLRLEEAEIPEPAADEVLLRVKAVGVCGSDIHFYVTGRSGVFTITEPFVMGHEFAGEIVEVGEDVKDFRKGDRVTVEPGVPCGSCFYCRIGRYNLCENLKFYGAPPHDGGYREYAAVNHRVIFKLPPSLSFEEGALMEPLAVAVQAVKRSGLSAGDSVAVFGSGPIGLLILQAAREAGATLTIATDVLDYRLKLAESLGADYVVNVSREDAAKSIKEMTEGRGVDVVFEASGAPAAFKAAFEAVRSGGVIVQVGIFEHEEISFKPVFLTAKELDVRGVFRYANVFPAAISLASQGRVKLKPLITHVFPLEQIKEAFQMIVEKRGNPVKVIIKP